MLKEMEYKICMGKSVNNQLKVSKQVSEFVQLYSKMWWNTKAEFPTFLQEKSYSHKKNQERITDKFINQFFKAIEMFPPEEEKRKDWKHDMQLIINSFINNTDLISKKDKEILLNDELIHSTESFTNEVKKFNPDMDMTDISQALRNVWIMNIIQLLFGQKTQTTPSIFGYSMLYPYTDNYLDDTEISTEEKLKISEVFEKRLAGHKIEPSNNYEKGLFNLVSKIEEQYDRSCYPELFESLLCIHDAQRKSLKQQGRVSGPYDGDILGISMEKGGSSVLADGYLVNGTLTEKEAAFFFGYGVLLQMCDDLQDAEKDIQEQHMTIFSQLYQKWYFDDITSKLINFTYELINNVDCFKCENISNLKSLIQRNCIQLILFAVANNKKAYSRKYFEQIQRSLPYTPQYILKLNKKLKKKYLNMNESYNGVKTDEIMLYALKDN